MKIWPTYISHNVCEEREMDNWKKRYGFTVRPDPTYLAQVTSKNVSKLHCHAFITAGPKYSPMIANPFYFMHPHAQGVST